MKNTPTSDEKVMVALVHGSVLLSFLGPIVPAILWNSQRHKSAYVRFHALQALGYQAMFFWFWIIAVFGVLFLSIVLVIPVILFLDRLSSDTTFIPFLIQPIIFIGIFGVFGLYFLLGFTGAVFSFVGREFRYPLLGSWLEKYLARGVDPDIAINEDQEYNWVGGMCHLTAILQLWGIVLPVIVWVTQKEKSVRLKFQAIQSIAYQGIAFVVYILWTTISTLLIFGMFFALIVGGVLSNGNEIPAPIGVAFVIILLIMGLFGMLVNLVGPLYLIFALVAAVSVIRGNNFHYPILGNIIERRITASGNLAGG